MSMAPVRTRRFFGGLLRNSFFQVDNVILGGDLNFSLGFMESWGHMAQIDLLSVVFVHMLEDHH